MGRLNRKELAREEREMARILEEALKPSRYCAYCHEVEITSENIVHTVYCSLECYKEAAVARRSKIREYGKAYRATHQPAYLKIRFAVLERDGFRCVYCGLTPQDDVVLQIDHVYPKAKGGENTMENFATACNYCNLGKGDVLIKRFLDRD